VTIKDNGQWASIAKIGFLPLARMKAEEKKRFIASLGAYTSREWRDTRTRTPARWSFATLVDAKEELAPSSIASLKHWSRIAARMGVEVEPIGRRDLAKLANYDALFIRETTAISNHTYRFARRAEQEGMPVIDDPLSMIRCTNKVYLNELMAMNKVPVPRGVMIAGPADLQLAADTLGFPLVLKIPDSHSRAGSSGLPASRN
jgi:glutathione synthase/RimK-type ligase-like ATP-grasp enzyme